MMRKGLSRDRPCFRSYKVVCRAKLAQVVCHSGVIWGLTEARKILVRMGVQKGREEGLEWRPLVGYVCRHVTFPIFVGIPTFYVEM